MGVVYEYFFLFFCKLFNFSLKVHGFSFVAFNFPALSDGCRFEASGVFTSFSRAMLVIAFFKIICIPCIVCLIAAIENINPETLIRHSLQNR